MSDEQSNAGSDVPVVIADGKSTRAAELEELRRQHLLTSNVPNFDSATTTPINLLDWQMQQRALKEQDRMSKTATTKMLQNYRGAVGEINSKLSSIKQEDRKGKQDAERYLHNYRSNMGDLKANRRSAGPKEPGGIYSNDGDEAPEDWNRESVATLASVFDKHGTTDTEFPRGTPYVATPNAMTPTPHDANDHATSDSVSNLQSQVASSNNSSEELEKDPAETAPMEESMIMVDGSKVLKNETEENGISTKVSDGSEAPKATMNFEAINEVNEDVEKDDWVSVESSGVPRPEDLPVFSTDSAEISDWGQMMKSDNISDADMDATDTFLAIESDAVTEAVTRVSAPADRASLFRLDVGFRFRLLSKDSNPSVDKYMAAVAEIIGNFVDEEPEMLTDACTVSYDKEFPPYVNSVEEVFSTASAADAKCFMVSACMPIFLSGRSGIAETRSAVCSAVRSAIDDGSLRALALGD